MFKTGLVSISFRSLPPSEIVALTKKCGLSYIEWGSDVHAPCDAPDALAEISALQLAHGLQISSYGTYFKIGLAKPEELTPYIHAAKKLGTNILRIWVGQKNYELYTAAELKSLFDDAAVCAKMAEDAGVILCAECHPNTVTNCLEGAEALLAHTHSPAFQMYWQPNQFRSVESNCAYARAVAPYVKIIHVFQWKERNRFPLSKGLREWETYLSYFDGSQTLLLEFMPDNNPDSMPAEAESLHTLVNLYPERKITNEINSTL